MLSLNTKLLNKKLKLINSGKCCQCKKQYVLSTKEYNIKNTNFNYSYKCDSCKCGLLINGYIGKSFYTCDEENNNNVHDIPDNCYLDAYIKNILLQHKESLASAEDYKLYINESNELILHRYYSECKCHVYTTIENIHAIEVG